VAGGWQAGQVATRPRDERPSILIPLLIALILLAIIGAAVGWFVGTRVNDQRARDGYAVSVVVIRG
jgi:hypothetical protein